MNRATVSKAGEPINIIIGDPLAKKIRKLHKISSVGDETGNKTSLQRWCIEIIENFILFNRKEQTR